MNNIKPLRKEKDLTLQQLADAAGVSKSHVFQIEKGADPALSVARHIAKRLKSPLGKVFPETVA